MRKAGRSGTAIKNPIIMEVRRSPRPVTSFNRPLLREPPTDHSPANTLAQHGERCGAAAPLDADHSPQVRRALIAAPGEGARPDLSEFVRGTVACHPGRCDSLHVWFVDGPAR